MLHSLRSSLHRTLLAGLLLALGAAAHAQQVLHVTAIPDESPTELARKAAPLVKYLERKLGMKVEFTPVTDYAASVETLVNHKVDLAWFGGFTFVQASARSGGKVIPIAQREEDERFRSVFITADPAIKTLADLKGKDVSFGAQSSTSGHLMPRSVLLGAGIDPDKDFKRVAYSGAHDATIAAVAAGKVQAGALNISVWEKFVAEKRVDTDKVRVFFTTAPYYDYNWSVSRDARAVARQAHAGVPGTRQEHARRQGDPRVAARDPLRADAARELQGHRGRGEERRAAVRAAAAMAAALP